MYQDVYVPPNSFAWFDVWILCEYRNNIKTISFSLDLAFRKNPSIGTSELRILTGKKHPKIKLQRLRKIRILTFRSLVHQMNSF